MFGDQRILSPCLDPGACRIIKEERDYFQVQLMDLMEQMAASPRTFQVDGRLVNLFNRWRQENAERDAKEAEARKLVRERTLERAIQKIRGALDPDEVMVLMGEANRGMAVADLVRPSPLLEGKGDEVWDAEETDMAAEPGEAPRASTGRRERLAEERRLNELQRARDKAQRESLRDLGLKKIMAALNEDERTALDITDLDDLRSTFTGFGDGT